MMSEARWQRILDIFNKALECHLADRADFLKVACDGDEELLQEVEALLASDAQAQECGFLVAEPAGNSVPEPDRNIDGMSIGSYELIEEIGRGGWGVVYKARQPNLDRLVAIKVILNDEYASESDRERFRREAKVLAGLHHPHIVQVFEFGEHEGRPFFSMEFVNGGSLAERLKTSRYTETDAAILIETLARTLHKVHQAGVIHRDLKPSNILLTTEDIAKVTDFGISKSLGEELQHTRTGSVMGCPSYMAPEQARGESKNVGPEADTYALGAILYELITGQPPFRGAATYEIISDVINRDAIAPRHIRADLSRDINTICLTCLNKDPNKRYQSAELLADDCRNLLDRRPIMARPVTSVERLWRWGKRRPVVASLMGSVVLLISALVVGSVLFALQQQAASEELTKKNFELHGINEELAQANVNLKNATSVADQKRIDAEIARGETELKVKELSVALAQLSHKRVAAIKIWKQLLLSKPPEGGPQHDRVSTLMVDLLKEIMRLDGEIEIHWLAARDDEIMAYVNTAMECLEAKRPDVALLFLEELRLQSEAVAGSRFVTSETTKLHRAFKPLLTYLIARSLFQSKRIDQAIEEVTKADAALRTMVQEMQDGLRIEGVSEENQFLAMREVGTDIARLMSQLATTLQTSDPHESEELNRRSRELQTFIRLR